jgi:hypothetical protein
VDSSSKAPSRALLQAANSASKTGLTGAKGGREDTVGFLVMKTKPDHSTFGDQAITEKAVGSVALPPV